MTPRTAKVRAKLYFRPRILLTLQCLTHNFKGSIFQIHSKMNLEIPRTRFRRLYKRCQQNEDIKCDSNRRKRTISEESRRLSLMQYKY